MNHKQYLLDLLDGSQSLSQEGIGMVVERLERLEAVAEAAKRPRIAFDYTDQLEAALAALENEE